MSNQLLLNVAILVFFCVLFIAVVVTTIGLDSVMDRLDDSVDILGDSVSELATDIEEVRETQQLTLETIDRIAANVE